MRVVISGWRGDEGKLSANQKAFLLADLEGWKSRYLFEQVGVGDATGVDAFAVQWCGERYLPFKKFDADWATYGRQAGPIRNRTMLNEVQPNLLLAYPHRNLGSGTMGCVEEARKRGVRTWVAPLPAA